MMTLEQGMFLRMRQSSPHSQAGEEDEFIRADSQTMRGTWTRLSGKCSDSWGAMCRPRSWTLVILVIPFHVRTFYDSMPIYIYLYV